jgi:SAM-dependent methyltransferase
VLHVGCGRADIRHLPAYFQKRWQEIRLDIDPDAHPDILGTALDMSAVPSHSVDAVYSSHTLEHLYAHELPIALAEMKRVLKPDGIMVATVPDLQAAARMIAEDHLFATAYQSPAGPITPFDIVYSYRGFVSRDRPYMAHHGGFTLTTLIDALKGAGFEAVTGKRRESAFDLWVLSVPEPMADDQLKQLSAAVLPD